MSEHPNITFVKQVVAGFNQGNPSAVMAAIADDAVFYMPGESPIAGEYPGKGEISRFFQHMGQLSEGPQTVEPTHFLTGGDEHVVVIWTARGTRKGMDYEGQAGWIFRVHNGQIVEGRNLQEDQAAIDEFWSA